MLQVEDRWLKVKGILTRFRMRDYQVSAIQTMRAVLAQEASRGTPELPDYTLHNAEGVLVFVAVDQDPAWRRCPRPAGRYVSTSWIPGNFLAEGMMAVTPAMRTLEPDVFHFHAPDAVVFQVIDDLDNNQGNTARGDYPRALRGAVSPLLRWSTEFTPNGREAAAGVTGGEA